MAFTIQQQPSSGTYNTCAFPIYHQISNTNTGVLYVVAQCQFYNRITSAWESIGGGMRLNRDINTPTTFKLWSEKIFQDKIALMIPLGLLGLSYIPKYSTNRVGDSRYMANGQIGTPKQYNYGLLKCRIKFYQERLNADGFIEQDASPNLTSNNFYVFEMGGKAKELLQTLSNANATDYHVSRVETTSDQHQPLSLAPEPIPTSHSSNNWLSWVVDNKNYNGTTQTNFQLVMITYSANVMVGLHWVDVDVSEPEWYMCATGLMDWEQAIINGDPEMKPATGGVPYFFAGEDSSGVGVDMSAVDSYQISLFGGGFLNLWLLGGQQIWTRWYEVIDAPNVFTSQLQCGLDNDTANVPELVFHFKNMLGGFDRYQMLGGKYKISAVTKADKWEKNYPFPYWWGTTAGGLQSSKRVLYDKYSCTTFKMNQTEAIWFREFLSSPEVYMEAQVGGEMFVTDETYSYWMQVYINPDSVEFIDTDEDLLEISFSFVVSKREHTVNKN